MIRYKQTLELLYQKRDLVTNMLTQTSELSFFGTAQENAQNYIELVEARQSCIAKIYEIEKELERHPHATILANPPKEFLKKAELLQQTIREQAKEMIEIDKKNAGAVQKAFSSLKIQVKGANVAKNIKGVYERDLPQMYSRVDKKK